jgi:hypothetical protein
MKAKTILWVAAGLAAVGIASGTVPVGVGSSAAPVSTQADDDVLRIIWTVGSNHGASDKVMLAAFETCVVESGCRNLPGGDRDSAGAFQQRPSMNWGTNVQLAARTFFTRAIAAEGCCPTSGLLAQEVQKSCCPWKYDQHESLARERMATGRALHIRWLRTHGRTS